MNEPGTHSFIVRIWCEEPAEEGCQATWRGHVTHLASGERRYIQRLEDLCAFIRPYLEAMGVRANGQWWRRWLVRLGLSSRSKR